MSGGGRWWPVVELAFPVSKFGQMDYRSVWLEVFGKEFTNKFLILMGGGGEMKLFSIFRRVREMVAGVLIIGGKRVHGGRKWLGVRLVGCSRGSSRWGGCGGEMAIFGDEG